MGRNRLLIVFFLTVIFGMSSISELRAQNTYPGDSFEGRVVVGSHALGGAGGALQDKLYGLDLTYQKDISHISDDWVKLANARAAGISVVFRDLQFLKGHGDTSTNAFGQALGLAGSLEFQLLKSGRTTVNLRPGIGLSYLSKTFFTDKKNRFIGSHLNEILKTDLVVQVPLGSSIDLDMGAGFLHYSNGGYNIPNSGINMLSLSGAMRFKKPVLHKEEYATRFNQLRKNTFEINAGVGRRGVYESHDGLLKSGVYGGYNYYINDLLSLKTGFDAVYYYTPFDPSPGRDIQTFQYYGTSFDKWRTGISAGGETTFWRLAVNAQLGKYLHYNSYYKGIEWFWTTGLIYYVTPHAGIQAKTYFHGSQADFINYGLVFKI